MNELDRPYHEVSNLFPLMDGEEYELLKADIAKNGLLEAIWLHPDGSIIDGRNRHRACLDTGTELRFRTWDNSSDLVDFVLSLNLHRRHLNETQRAIIAEKAANMPLGGAVYRSLNLDSDNKMRLVDAADRLNVSRATVATVRRIKRDAPDLLPDMERGDLTANAAMRELKERKREAQRETNRELVNQTTAPEMVLVGDKRYQTIVLDPPWDWGDEGDQDQFGRARPTYATMPLAEIAALPIPELATPNAHIYLWITNRSLPKGFSLLDGWGFRYITMLTWCKPHFGMGNYFRGSTEQVLFGVRGSLALLRKDMGTWFEAPRPGQHSGKPHRFYEIVESCSPGPWLELFSRCSRPGWATWGAENDRTNLLI